MATNALAAYGIYRDRIALSDVLSRLNHGGFENENICMMLSPTHPIAAVVREASVWNDECKTSEGTIGWLNKFGAVVIPSVGFFIRSREFFRAILGEEKSSNRCGSSTTLMGLGFSERDANHVQKQLRGVGVLLYVSCAESAKSKCALELLRDAGAEEAGTLEETDVLGDQHAFVANA
jgi:hypothetical protein